MSKIGNNIKKIRSVKNLNQSDFADLFNLKRASIGAYEEGRAEPKISTLIDIANYFGISTDDLLKKELSVNELYRFDIFRDDLIKDTKHNLTPTVIPVDIIAVPYVSKTNKAIYLKDRKSVSSFESINLPLSKGLNYRAFQIEDNAMFNGASGINTDDIVIAYKTDKFTLSEAQPGKIYLFELENDFLVRRLHSKSLSKIQLEPTNPDHYGSIVPSKAIVTIWQISRVITNNIGNTSNETTKLQALEDEISLLKRNLLNNG